MDGLIPWDDKYVTGAVTLDNQHKQLLNMINLLNVAVKKGKSPLIMTQTMQSLAEYSVFHFAAEEEVMREVKFPKEWEAPHREEHNRYITRIMDFQRGMDQGKRDLDREMILYLRDWWDRHILVTDMKYKPYLQ